MKIFKIEGTLIAYPSIRIEISIEAEDWEKALNQVDQTKIQIYKITEIKDPFPGSSMVG